MYLSHSRMPQSGAMRSRSSIGRLGGRGHHLAVGVSEGDAAHAAAVARPAAVVDGAHEVQEHLLALAAHHGVDPRRLLQHLRVHEGAVDAAQHGDDVRVHLLGDLQQPLGLVDRRRDRGAADDVGLQRRRCAARTWSSVRWLRHRVDEDDVGVAAGLQVAGQVGDPGGRPVAGDLGAAGVVVRMDQHDAHGQTLSPACVTLELHIACNVKLT